MFYHDIKIRGITQLKDTNHVTRLVGKNLAISKNASHDDITTAWRGDAFLVSMLANSFHFGALFKSPPDVGTNLLEETSSGRDKLRRKGKQWAQGIHGEDIDEKMVRTRYWETWIGGRLNESMITNTADLHRCFACACEGQLTDDVILERMRKG